MSVLEIAQQIQPLSREEKRQLLHEIQQMLADEEDTELRQFFTPGEIIDYHGPIIEPKIAQQLQEFMEKKHV